MAGGRGKAQDQARDRATERQVHEELRQLVLRYCRAVDRRDFELLQSLYHPDALEDHGGMFCGPAAEFIEQLPEIMAPMDMTMHYICNTLFACDGDRAQGEIYTIAVHRVRATEEGAKAHFMIGGGRYLDHYECRDDRCWRFAQRKIVADWELELPAPQQLEPLLEGVARGQASAADPSYAFLSLLPRGRS